MKFFITGGAGFMGLHFLERILPEGHEVVVYDRVPLDAEWQAKKGVTFVEGDVRDKAKLTEAMRGCDILIHNAAVLPVSRSGKDFWEINVKGTRAVLEAGIANKVKKAIFISTSSVYGVPKSVPVSEATPLTPLGKYGFSKLEAEKVVQELRGTGKIDISIVRPRTIIGQGRMGIFGILFDWIAAGKRIYIIGKGDNLYQFLSAPDLADACYRMTQKPCCNEDFLIGAEQFGTVKGDMEAIIKHAGTASKVQPTNAFIVRNILRVVDWMKISPLVDWHYMTPHKPMFFDVTKAKTMLGWTPKDSNLSMFTETYDWYMKNREELSKQTGVTHRKSAKQGVLRLLKMFS
jgi:nucleoside-diphosphate-sugar epimerase